jgi:GAF domain-containing protein
MPHHHSALAMATSASSSAKLSSTSEQQRLNVLNATGLLEGDTSEGFDRIARLAQQMFDMPIAAITLIDASRLWFKSPVGLEAEQVPRELAFCDHTIRSDEVMVVEDARLDLRFAANPLVAGESGIRFYAGAPLVMQSGHAIGALCLVDRVPRVFSDTQRQQCRTWRPW